MWGFLAVLAASCVGRASPCAPASPTASQDDAAWQHFRAGRDILLHYPLDKVTIEQPPLEPVRSEIAANLDKAIAEFRACADLSQDLDVRLAAVNFIRTSYKALASLQIPDRNDAHQAQAA